jgi:hypothetical protein
VFDATIIMGIAILLFRKRFSLSGLYVTNEKLCFILPMADKIVLVDTSIFMDHFRKTAKTIALWLL